MVGPEPEQRVGAPAVRQRWVTMTFLHWPYDPDVVQGLLPSGLQVDTHDGRAWVGLTPFLMTDIRPPGLFPVSRLSTFPETNLRTYVRAPDGADGLWFLSLEADSLATVAGARALYWVPYHWAAMSVEREGDEIRYHSSRRPPEDAKLGHRISVKPGRPCRPAELTPFDHFLTGRWRGYTRIAGHLCRVAVEHEPWPLWRAEVVELEETLTRAAGLPAPEGDPVVHFSPGVHDVRLGVPRPVGGSEGVHGP